MGREPDPTVTPVARDWLRRQRMDNRGLPSLKSCPRKLPALRGEPMAGGRVHFELFVRKYPDSDWKLDMASEARSAVVDMAKERVARGEVVAARVAKETLDEGTGEFSSLNILTLGVPEKRSKPKVPESTEPLCIAPQ